jgi:hypothetical protein
MFALLQELAVQNKMQTRSVQPRGTGKFLGLFNEHVCRGDDTIDSNTCKIHCHLHILQNMLMFGDPMQCGAAKGEQGLMDWAKHMSKTAQKCGIDTFLVQTMNRVLTQQLMQRPSRGSFSGSAESRQANKTTMKLMLRRLPCCGR